MESGKFFLSFSILTAFRERKSFRLVFSRLSSFGWRLSLEIKYDPFCSSVTGEIFLPARNANPSWEVEYIHSVYEKAALGYIQSE